MSKEIVEQLKNIVRELRILNKNREETLSTTNVMIGSEGNESKKKIPVSEYERQIILNFDTYKEQIMNRTIKISEK